MKKVRLLAQHYINFLVKLGVVRFSLLFASALVTLAFVVQITVTLVLRGGMVENVDLVRSIFLGLLITPWAVYFFSIIVEQLEDSRQQLSHLVDKLKKEMAHREQIQYELGQQSTLLRSFLDASPDLVYYRNEKREFSGCNRAMELLSGKSEKQLIGLTVGDIYPRDVAKKVIETDEKVLRHNLVLTYEQWLVYPDGRKACFELRKVPFYDRVGKRHGLMGFGRDITERKCYQDALENASKDKTTFISTISHELRTPLNGIVGLSRILLDTELNAEQLKYLKTIHASAITLGNIFNDIIEMDKFERRKVQLDNQPLDFTDFLADLDNLSSLLVQPKELNFMLEPQTLLPQKVITDGTRLRQILWNLIGNAVKFTTQGQIVVRVWHEAPDNLIFEIEDSGVGIAENEQDKIFTMYYQVKDHNGGHPVTGAGIGLAVSKCLAQCMGGDITVKSTLGKGSCFTLAIKALSVQEEAKNSTQSNNELLLPTLNVLLVEDIELNVVVARSVLEKLGSRVDVAMNGHDALAMFDPDYFDLVLLDIQLPDMTGLDIARQIHERYAQRALPPLVALTANVLENKKYLDAGMSAVLSKPLSVSALMAVIKQFWDHQPSHTVKKQEDKLMQANVSLLDTTILEQYMDLVGPSLIHQSLDMFEQIMPNYLAVLDSTMLAQDQRGITGEAHKIKGAAGSVGLCHLQQLAQQIQTLSLPAWQDNVQDWVDELKREWRNDVRVLREWVTAAEKNNPDRVGGAQILRKHQGNH